ncbi:MULTISPECIES: TauD/TfdA dioxygenase family protein [Pseudofrankia]|uniref:TauD/TfdA dioxygenase family protein n=1 Tax=Pseudofrankia TaxID=2994363 RepID=UPI000234D812|nr:MULTISPECIES: TauD/TfdA family dioxygenase [Pseudofrankia]OHV33838.1 taurine catabolism dioxygenase TauD [Pseudofrankia sp. EUN1h]
MTTTITCEPLAATVGAEVSGVDAERLAQDDTIAGSILEALEQFGVLVFRGLNLEPDNQVAFCRRLGEIDFEPGHHPVAGIYRVTLDQSKNSSAAYLRGTFAWHMDGCTPLHGEPPQKATILSAKQVAANGGETEFASTYAGYDALSDAEKERFASLRVMHTFEASQRTVYPDPTPEQLEKWRARPTSAHPLVWTHRTGRRSLVIGAHASHIVGMDLDEGRALLGKLLDHTTAGGLTYRHEWSVGDTVIWDNTGVVHRAAPYDPSSPREMLRTTVFGDEPIQ